MKPQIGVRCSCGRAMQPAALGGVGSFRCGCGAGATLTGLPKFDAGHCSLFLGGRICNGPKEPDWDVCEPCMIRIARNATVNPETAEQLATHLGRMEFYAMQSAERERLRQERREELTGFARRSDALDVHVVYYCRTRPGIVKIGTSMQMAVRMRSFRIPTEDVLAAEPGTYDLERMRHKQFAELRIHPQREDFRFDDNLRSHVDMLRAIFGAPYDFVENLRTQQRELAEAAKSG